MSSTVDLPENKEITLGLDQVSAFNEACLALVTTLLQSALAEAKQLTVEDISKVPPIVDAIQALLLRANLVIRTLDKPLAYPNPNNQCDLQPCGRLMASSHCSDALKWALEIALRSESLLEIDILHALSSKIYQHLIRSITDLATCVQRDDASFHGVSPALPQTYAHETNSMQVLELYNSKRYEDEISSVFNESIVADSSFAEQQNRFLASCELMRLLHVLSIISRLDYSEEGRVIMAKQLCAQEHVVIGYASSECENAKASDLHSALESLSSEGEFRNVDAIHNASAIAKMFIRHYIMIYEGKLGSKAVPEANVESITTKHSRKLHHMLLICCISTVEKMMEYANESNSSAGPSLSSRYSRKNLMGSSSITTGKRTALPTSQGQQQFDAIMPPHSSIPASSARTISLFNSYPTTPTSSRSSSQTPGSSPSTTPTSRSSSSSLGGSPSTPTSSRPSSQTPGSSPSTTPTSRSSRSSSSSLGGSPSTPTSSRPSSQTPGSSPSTTPISRSSRSSSSSLGGSPSTPTSSRPSSQTPGSSPSNTPISRSSRSSSSSLGGSPSNTPIVLTSQTPGSSPSTTPTGISSAQSRCRATTSSPIISFGPSEAPSPSTGTISPAILPVPRKAKPKELPEHIMFPDLGQGKGSPGTSKISTPKKVPWTVEQIELLVDCVNICGESKHAEIAKILNAKPAFEGIYQKTNYKVKDKLRNINGTNKNTRKVEWIQTGTSESGLPQYKLKPEFIQALLKKEKSRK